MFLPPLQGSISYPLEAGVTFPTLGRPFPLTRLPVAFPVAFPLPVVCQPFGLFNRHHVLYHGQIID